MKLKYYRGDNFGDALNPVIWQHYLSDYLDDNNDELFVGIGTLFGFEYPREAKKIVFSTGATVDGNNYYGRIPTLDENWEIFCVRGPLTAELLKIDKKYAITDGAILVNQIFNGSIGEKKVKFIYATF